MSKYNYFIEEGGIRYPLTEIEGQKGSYSNDDIRDKLVDYEYTTNDGITKKVEWPAYIIMLPKEELPEPDSIGLRILKSNNAETKFEVVDCEDCDDYAEAVRDLYDENS